MIMDNTLVFSDGQAITAEAGSTNVIDLGATGTPYGAASALVRDIGKGGCNISLYVGVVEAFNTLTSLQISLQVDDNAAFSSAKTVAQSDRKSVVSGKSVSVRLDLGGRRIIKKKKI